MESDNHNPDRRHVPDRSLKAHVHERKRSLQRILKLQPVTYTAWFDDRVQVGFIADDLRREIPEAVRRVHRDGVAFNAVVHSRLAPDLVGAVQALHEALATMRKQSAVLHDRVAALESGSGGTNNPDPGV